MAKVIGVCHICGTNGPLTFEHVPPQSAFNESPLLMAKGEQLFSGRGYDKLRLEKQRKGAGAYTLCARCNNNTGSWYGADYVSWAKQSTELLDRAKGAPTLLYPLSIFPLRVVKQIVTMFFSVNSPEFRTRVPYLEGFVLDKYRRHLPTEVRILVGYALRGATRNSGVSGLLAMDEGTQQAFAISEIAFFPFVFVMALESPSPDPRLTDISAFAQCGYNERRIVDLRLSVLPVNTPYPSDYRTTEHVSAAASEAARISLKQI